MTIPAIISNGSNDYYTHGGEYRNPYGAGTPEFNSYERGWMQSLKRDSARRVKLPSSPPRAPVIQSHINLYALEKGRDGPRKPK